MQDHFLSNDKRSDQLFRVNFLRQAGKGDAPSTPGPWDTSQRFVYWTRQLNFRHATATTPCARVGRSSTHGFSRHTNTQCNYLLPSREARPLFVKRPEIFVVRVRVPRRAGIDARDVCTCYRWSACVCREHMRIGSSQNRMFVIILNFCKLLTCFPFVEFLVLWCFSRLCFMSKRKAKNYKLKS